MRNFDSVAAGIALMMFNPTLEAAWQRASALPQTNKRMSGLPGSRVGMKGAAIYLILQAEAEYYSNVI